MEPQKVYLITILKIFQITELACLWEGSKKRPLWTPPKKKKNKNKKSLQEKKITSCVMIEFFFKHTLFYIYPEKVNGVLMTYRG